MTIQKYAVVQYRIKNKEGATQVSATFLTCEPDRIVKLVLTLIAKFQIAENNNVRCGEVELTNLRLEN